MSHHRTICNRDCPDSCGIIAEVENGRIVKQRGDPEHGITRGFLCKRGNRYLERFYSPNRIVHPLRRTSAGAWEQISWDAALDLAAEKLRQFRASFGPASILAVTYSGIKGLVAKAKWRTFWSELEASVVHGGLSSEAVHAGQALDFGGDTAHSWEDFTNAAGFVVWGKNIAVTYPHSFPFVQAARKKGARLLVVDPVRSMTARKADRHFQLRPGSDGMLALGIARLLLERRAIDGEFIEAHTTGFEDYERLVRSITLDEVLSATQLERAQIEELADCYGTVKPLNTMAGLGIGYWRDGGATTRLIDALAAITGNIGVSGGGVFTDTAAAEGLDLSVLSKPFKRKILLPRLGQEILAAENPPIKMAWIAGANPAATAPDTGRVDRALAQLDFLVVVDQFLTASANYAELFLPCTTYLEHDDLVRAYGHHWLGMNRAVVPPMGEARSDTEILEGLAERMGVGDLLEGSTDEWATQLLGELTRHSVSTERLREGPLPNPLKKPVPFDDRRFPTPSGRYEFVTAYERRSVTIPKGALRLMATKSIFMVNAQINERDLKDNPVVRVHPQTLAAQGLSDQQEVWVESAVGRVRARITADPAVLPEVLQFNPAAWRGDLQRVNQLREAALTDLGRAAAMHDTWIYLEGIPSNDPDAV